MYISLANVLTKVTTVMLMIMPNLQLYSKYKNLFSGVLFGKTPREHILKGPTEYMKNNKYNKH